MPRGARRGVAVRFALIRHRLHLGPNHLSQYLKFVPALAGIRRLVQPITAAEKGDLMLHRGLVRRAKRGSTQPCSRRAAAAPGIKSRFSVAVIGTTIRRIPASASTNSRNWKKRFDAALGRPKRGSNQPCSRRAAAARSRHKQS